MAGDMERLDFEALLEAAGREFDARIQRAGFYQHPSGVGDAREDIVREYLQDVLSRRFVVERGKIMDSDGRLSREFDVIISEANDVAPAMMLAGRRIVPIESVYGVIEVKSSLSAEGYGAFVSAVEDLKQMKRRYRRLVPLPSHVAPIVASPFAISELEIGSQDQTGGRIWSEVVAFEAPGGRTLAEYFAKRCEGFWFICVPGRELVTLSTNPPGCRGMPYKLKSLPLTVWLIMNLVTDNSRPLLLFPDFSKYRSHIVTALGDLTDCWTATFEEDGPSK